MGKEACEASAWDWAADAALGGIGGVVGGTVPLNGKTGCFNTSGIARSGISGVATSQALNAMGSAGGPVVKGPARAAVKSGLTLAVAGGTKEAIRRAVKR